MSLTRNTYNTSGIKSYKDNEVNTMSPGKLIVMLYDGAIRFLTIASENISNYKKYDFVNENVNRAHDIINELISSLDMEKGGDISKNLLSLYLYVKSRVLEGNVQKDPALIKEAIKILSELKSSWEEILKKEAGSQNATGSLPRKGLSIQG
jgi:flagellar secretion chaperone FliS